jgi:hypothetical protein
MTDRLLGLKENVIIGKLIPARATVELPPEPVKQFFLPGLERPDGMPPELALAMGEGDEEPETRELELEAMMAEPFETGVAEPLTEEEESRRPEVPQTYFAEPDEDEEEEEEEVEEVEDVEEEESGEPEPEPDEEE